MSDVSTLPPLADLRADFPGMVTADGKPWHYLDTAATAQKPRAVIDAMARALGEDYATVHRGVYTRSAEMTLAYEAARRTVARFIGGHEEELVFTRGATEAINLIAQTWGRANLNAGDRILLSQAEHHSNIVPWQLLAERKGAVLKFIGLDENECLNMDELERTVNERTKLVSLPHVSNVLGFTSDVERIVKTAKQFNCRFLCFLSLIFINIFIFLKCF